MKCSKKDASRTIQYSLANFVPFCEREMIKFSGGGLFSVDSMQRDAERFEFCPSLFCWIIGRRIMARVASGVVFNQVHCALLPYPAFIFWLLLLRLISGFIVALYPFSQNKQSIGLLGAGEGGSGGLAVMVWGCTRDWGWYDRRLTCFVRSLFFIFIQLDISPQAHTSVLKCRFYSPVLCLFFYCLTSLQLSPITRALLRKLHVDYWILISE